MKPEERNNRMDTSRSAAIWRAIDEYAVATAWLSVFTTFGMKDQIGNAKAKKEAAIKKIENCLNADTNNEKETE
jgi:hypothetical protein